MFIEGISTVSIIPLVDFVSFLGSSVLLPKLFLKGMTGVLWAESLFDPLIVEP